MKITSKNLFAALVLASFSTVAFADNTETKTTETKTATATSTSTKTTEAMKMTGRVENVMGDKHMFALSTTEGTEKKEVNVWWSPTTKLAWQDAKSTAAMQSDLKTGAMVVVKAEKNAEGNLVATEIWFTKMDAPGMPAGK